MTVDGQAAPSNPMDGSEMTIPMTQTMKMTVNVE